MNLAELAEAKTQGFRRIRFHSIRGTGHHQPGDGAHVQEGWPPLSAASASSGATGCWSRCPTVRRSSRASALSGGSEPSSFRSNHMIGAEESAFIYRDCGAETLISSTDFLPRIEACRASAPALRNVILVGSSVPQGYHSYPAARRRESGRDQHSQRRTMMIWPPSSTLPEPPDDRRERCTHTTACTPAARC